MNAAAKKLVRRLTTDWVEAIAIHGYPDDADGLHAFWKPLRGRLEAEATQVALTYDQLSQAVLAASQKPRTEVVL